MDSSRFHLLKNETEESGPAAWLAEACQAHRSGNFAAADALFEAASSSSSGREFPILEWVKSLRYRGEFGRSAQYAGDLWDRAKAIQDCDLQLLTLEELFHLHRRAGNWPVARMYSQQYFRTLFSQPVEHVFHEKGMTIQAWITSVEPVVHNDDRGGDRELFSQTTEDLLRKEFIAHQACRMRCSPNDILTVRRLISELRQIGDFAGALSLAEALAEHALQGRCWHQGLEILALAREISQILGLHTKAAKLSHWTDRMSRVLGAVENMSLAN